MSRIAVGTVDLIAVPVRAGRPTTATSQENAKQSWFRPDIEGLRALAVILVVLYHAGVHLISGGYVGVDVFFVISGFLITQLLAREFDTSGTISIVGFYARRAARLLPAASVVVLAVLVASWAYLPPTRFRSIATDVLTTTVSSINWRLAWEGTDYLGAAEAVSPVQHFWSLAVEEQFYVVWPLLLSATLLLARQARRAMVTGVLAVIIGVSLSLSVWQTQHAAPWAYFGSHTRAWELAVGALVAIHADRFRGLSRYAATFIGCSGTVAIVASAVLFSDTTAFPGSAALLPVLATAAVIAAGAAAPLRYLSIRPMQKVGALSYSWYLWHWPILLIAPYVVGHRMSGWQNLGLVSVALLLAAATFVLVEAPFRNRRSLRRRPWRAVRLGLATSACVALIAYLAPLTTRQVGQGDAATVLATAGERQWAEVLTAAAETKDVPVNLNPPVLMAPKDLPVFYRDGCDPPFTDSEVRKPCAYGDTAAKPIMVLFGDSHAGQWEPALDIIAKLRHLRLVVVTKSSCNAAIALVKHPALNRPYTECDAWRVNAFGYLAQLRPAIVVMASNGQGGTILGVSEADQDRAWTQAWAASVRRVRPSTSKVVVISDTPWPSVDVAGCVSLHPTDIQRCEPKTSEAILVPGRRAAIVSAVTHEGATVIDPTAWLCTTQVCPVVVGNTLVFRDSHHLTTVYSAQLAPLLAARLPP